MAPEEEINKLKAELERHNKLYYQDDNPEISDAEYDALYQRFKDLEAKQNKKEKLSPTDKVGAKPVRNFEKHDHIKPMLSLNNVFNEEEFEILFNQDSLTSSNPLPSILFLDFKTEDRTISFSTFFISSERSDSKWGDLNKENINAWDIVEKKFPFSVFSISLTVRIL